MNKILVIQTASIGDVILATALIESLHQAYPAASIDFLVKKGYEGLFAGHPFLDKVITWDKRAGKYSGILQIIKNSRRIKYDLIVNIQRFFLTGLLTVLSGSRETRGFSKNPLSSLFSKKIEHVIGDGIHEVARNHALISDLAVSDDTRPKLYPSKEDEAVAGQYITAKYYTISPASLWFTKQYPVEKWIELIRFISTDATVLLLGAATDQELCNEIILRACHPGTINLAGKLTLLQSAALMKGARMNFTNDSAPMHLATAVNAPVAAIYCSTVPAFGFGPLSVRSTIVETPEKLSCRPCGLHGYKSCPETHFNCAFTIRVEQLAHLL